MRKFLLWLAVCCGLSSRAQTVYSYWEKGLFFYTNCIIPEMRTFLIWLSVLCWKGNQAQNQFSYHYGRDVAHGAISLGGTLYYLETQFDMCCRTSINLAKSRNGQFISRKQISMVVANAYLPLIDVTTDNCLAVVSASARGGCDSYSTPGHFICKVDTSGIQKWKVPVKSVTHILCLPDTSIIYVSNNKIFRLNANGVLKDSLTTGTGTIQSLCRYNTDSFLVNHLNAAGPNIKKVSNKLLPGPDVLVGVTNEKMSVLGDSTVIALAGGKLIRYNKTFVWAGNSDSAVPPGIFTIKQLTVVRDTIYCLATGTGQNTNELHYLMLNKSLTLLHQAKANFKYAEPRAIALTGNKVNVLTTSPGSKISTNTYIDIIQLPKTGAITATSDVGLTSATLSAQGNSLMNIQTIIKAEVTVKNFGTTPVQSFHLNFSGDGVPWCWESGFSVLIHQPLAPGESYTIDSLEFGTHTGFGTPWLAQICFYTTIPNNTHDIGPNNDAFCVTTLVVGAGDNSNAEPFKIFPNPSSKEIHLEGDVIIKSVDFLDVTGRLLLKSEIENQKSCTLSHTLPDGVYLLRVRAGDQVYLRKVAVQN